MSSIPPLKGLRVLEFGQIAAGPFAGSLLADLGADVVKVERPDGGDGMRQWPPLSECQGDVFSENFASLNRNKRSITVDLKDPIEVERLKDLCKKADVLLENFRPSVLERLGLGYDDLSKENRGLVYCSISGYGQKGPYAKKGAFDVTVQAMSGLMSVTGEEGRVPVKCGVPVGDFAAGLYAAYTVMAAIYRRQATGVGAFIDCSMLGSLIGIAALQTSEFFGTGNTPRRLGSAHPRNAPYQAYPASDEHFVIAAGNDKLWRAVCDAVDQPALADDARFASQALRAQNQTVLEQILTPLFRAKPAAYWLNEMDRRGVPCAPINTYPEILRDPQVAAMGLVKPITLPNGKSTNTTAFPVDISQFSFEISRPPPRLGADNEHVWSDWV
jgi:succinate---hydroxymethylglutarate CoA-transferase